MYAGENPDQPQVGDLRITFTQVPENDISIVAKKVGSSFEPYRAKNGSTVDLQRKGIFSADEMITKAEEENTGVMWMLRVIGFLLMVIGIRLMLKPLATIANAIPLFGHLVGTEDVA